MITESLKLVTTTHCALLRRSRHLAVMLLSAVVFVGCAGPSDHPDLHRFVRDTHSDTKPEIEPLPPLRLPEKFIYTASEDVDPFAQENLVDQKEEEVALDVANAPDATRFKEPLEAFDLDKLVLVGLMDQDDGIWAVVKAPDETVHRVSYDNYMGLNNGRIVDITDNRVVVEEKLQDSIGNWSLSEKEINLLE